MTDNNKNYSIGTFEVTSGKLLVTDPCYNRGTWCSGMLENVKNGKWYANVNRGTRGNWGNRNAALFICHESFKMIQHYDFYFDKLEKIDVGVDSGQAGFFCDSIYPVNKPTGEYGEAGTFYDDACNATLETENHAGIVQGKGVASSSGFGDGSYRCYTSQNEAGEIVFACIEFIPEFESDEEEWVEDEETESEED